MHNDIAGAGERGVHGLEEGLGAVVMTRRIRVV